MKILLVATNTLKTPYPVYPIGIDYLVGAIGSSHETRIVDLCPTDGLKDFTKAILDFSPDIVGISLRNIDNADATDTASYIEHFKQVKRLMSEYTTAPIVLGGSAFSLFPKQLMQILDADYGIVGEGERLTSLLDALENGRSTENLPGVITRDLKYLPPEPWPGLCSRRFDSTAGRVEYYVKHGGMLNVQSKRGCPHKCIYCTYPLIEGRDLRLFDPERVAADARELQDAGARYLFIADSVFNSSIEHSLAVALAFKKMKIDIPWGAYFSPGKQPQDYFLTLADCGLRHVEFGTEAMNDKMLAALGKPFRLNDIIISHEQAVSAGLHVAQYMLLGGPGENAQTVSQTLDNLEKLDRCAVFFFCGIRIYPNTRLHALAIEQGVVRPNDDLLFPVFYRSPAISPELIETEVKRRAAGHSNWVVGAGGAEMNTVIERLHKRGRVGPLWENLIRR